MYWGLNFFEFQFPANRKGHDPHGDPFNLIQLKIIKEVISITVLTSITESIFNHLGLIEFILPLYLPVINVIDWI